MTDYKVIYLAGPLEPSGRIDYIRAAVEVAEEILTYHCSAIIPHTMTVMWGYAYPKSKSTWLALDKAIIAKCDAILRIPGDSEGADEEMRFAKSVGIPIYGTVEELAHDWRFGKGIFNEQNG